MKKKALFFLLPSVVGFFTLYILPLFSIFRYASVDNAFSGRFVGLDNFYDVLGNEYFRLASENTAMFTFIAVPAIMSWSVVISFVLMYISKKLRFVKSVFFLTIVLPSSAITLVWKSIFPDVLPFLSLLIIYLWKYSGINIMILTTALTNMDPAQHEAAEIDGAGVIRRSLFVTLPNIVPALLFSLILSVANSFRIYRESYLLYGQYPDDSVYMLQNFLNNQFMRLNYQTISAAAIIFGGILYVLIAIILILEKKWSAAG